MVSGSSRNRASVKDARPRRFTSPRRASTGYWKLKSSDEHLASGPRGHLLAGYAFDQAYTDVAGGVLPASASHLGPLRRRGDRDNRRKAAT